MKYCLTKWYGFPMGPCDTSCFEMQIVTYAHCPSQALQPIDRLKQILLIIEYLMAIIKSLMEVLTPHFQFFIFLLRRPAFDSLTLSGSVKNHMQLIAIKLGIEFMLRILCRLFPVNLHVLTGGEHFS